MTEISDPHDGTPAPGGNLPEFTVSALSQAIKRNIETGFARVRVRGEVSGYKRAASGHLYMSLKDENAVLDAVCWRGVAGKLSLVPEDGMEVIATGRMTTYPGRSKYQIVIDWLELAGEGALLKLLEERRKKLAAEGLFEEARKRPLPYLPEVIGVITSPTGAVIRDILHRLADRFPRRVLLWPTLVQGEDAAAQVAAAIEGFNRLAPGAAVPRPDLLIVARGGGSLEDLWAFNEEIVVRAAAASEIPLISAVGHETDTTLIDFAADRRAPTPTAAAEMAVPVRAELLTVVLDLGRRMVAGAGRMVEARRTLVEGLGRGLPDPVRLLEEKSQRLDDRAERLGNAVRNWLQGRNAELARMGAKLPHPRQQITLAKEKLKGRVRQLKSLRQKLLDPQRHGFNQLDAARRLARATGQLLDERRQTLGNLARVLESVSYQNVLARGFAVVRGPEGLIAGPADARPGLALDIEFVRDQHVAARVEGAGPGQGKPEGKTVRKTLRKTARESAVTSDDDPQGSLL